MGTAKYLDCCKEPSLETVKSFLSAECDMAAIRRCRTCGCHWYYRLREHAFSNADTYDRSIWYVRLTPEETDTLIQAAAAPEPSLFADRPGFLMDADGMNSIQGVPEFLR